MMDSKGPSQVPMLVWQIHWASLPHRLLEFFTCIVLFFALSLCLRHWLNATFSLSSHWLKPLLELGAPLRYIFKLLWLGVCVWSFMFLFLQLEGHVSTTQGVVSQNNGSQNVLAIDWFLCLSLRAKRRLGKVGSNRIHVISHEGEGCCGLLCGWPQLCFFTHPHISRPSDISPRTQTHTLDWLENFASSAFSPILSLDEMVTRVGAGQMWRNIWIECLLFSVPLSEMSCRFAFSGMPRKL